MFGGIAYVAMIGYSAKLAWADWFRRHPNPERIERAIRLDPLNAYAYTLQAELIEQAGGDSRTGWLDAARRDSRNAEILIRAGLAAETHRDLSAAEQLFLQAAQYNQTWLPRWTLASFYSRCGKREDALRWSGLAAGRAGGDLRPLFRLMAEAGATPDRLVRDLLPANRHVLVSYLSFALAGSESTGVDRAAERLAGLIPESVPGWPGLDRDPASLLFHRSYPASAAEREVLLSAVDAMLSRNRLTAATGLWNTLAGRGIVAGARWSPDQPIVNGQFRTAPAGGGLDWRIAKTDGVDGGIWPDAGEAAFTLSGRQAEGLDLLSQVLCLPANRTYAFHFESKVERLPGATGLRFEFRDFTSGAPIGEAVVVPGGEDWTASRGELAATPDDRVVLLALCYRRQPGTVRREGAVRVRSVRLESRP